MLLAHVRASPCLTGPIFLSIQRASWSTAFPILSFYLHLFNLLVYLELSSYSYYLSLLPGLLHQNMQYKTCTGPARLFTWSLGVTAYWPQQCKRPVIFFRDVGYLLPLYLAIAYSSLLFKPINPADPTNLAFNIFLTFLNLFTFSVLASPSPS